MDKLEIQTSLGFFKPHSSFSEMLSKFSKACKFRSIGVHAHHHAKLLRDYESSSNSTDDHVEENKECGHMEMSKLFDTLLALKLAYVKLQQAHIPYDPDKIRAADGEVVSHLESLCKIRKACKEKLLKEVRSGSTLLFDEIKVQEKDLDMLKVLAGSKDNELVNLKRELRELEMRNKQMADQIREENVVGVGHYDVFKAVAKAIHEFSKPLIALLKVSDWDLDQAANVIQNSVVYAKRSHKKYAFEAFVARKMFHGFSPHRSDLESLMKFDEAFDALVENPRSSFAKFCRNKYLSVIHSKVEASFFGNLDHRTLLVNGIHPCTPFYRAFVKMARWVWFLQGFNASVDSEVEMYSVKQGSDFSDAYMEVPEELNEYKTLLLKGGERLKVEFMIMPGFRQGETLIRSQVYVSKVGFSDDAQ